MKVLFFSHQAEFIYGGEICTLAFMRELAGRGVEVHFASPAGPYHERAREFAVCHEVPSVQFSRRLALLLRLLPALFSTREALSRIMSRHGIDLLHATSLKAMVYAWLVGRHTPVIWHHHDILPENAVNRWWLRRISSRARIILAPSDATREALLEAGVEAQKCKTLRNGFLVSEWSARPVRNSYSPFRVALVGEISPRKGTDRLAGILRAVRERGGIEGMEFLVIGEGLSDPAFASAIRSELKQDPVSFLGRREDVKDLLQNVDLLLVPSRQDPLPTVIVEASLSGIPSVGSRAGGIPEMIRNGESGFLAESAEEFADALQAARDLAVWRRLSASARREAERRFDIAALAGELLAIYGNVHAAAK